MLTRFQFINVDADNAPEALTAGQLFARDRDADEPETGGRMALAATVQGADYGIALIGTVTQLHAWLDRARAALRAKVPTLRGQVFPEGHDGRYRLWTAAHGLGFDDVPGLDDGGPATVADGPWSHSTTELSTAMSSPSVVAAAHDGTVTAHVRNVHTMQPHPQLDGAEYATRRDAKRAAYDAGVLAFMVYEREAPRWGLPIDGDAEAIVGDVTFAAELDRPTAAAVLPRTSPRPHNESGTTDDFYG